MPFIRRDVLLHVRRVSSLNRNNPRIRRGASPPESSQLCAHHCYDNASFMRGLPVFEQKNSLPRSQLHPRIGDRGHFARSRQDHPDVRRHVVRSFVVVLEVTCVFGHEAWNDRSRMLN